jgi:hypothetical protein
MGKLVKGPEVLYLLVSEHGWGVVDTKREVKDQLRQYRASSTEVEVVEYVPRPLPAPGWHRNASGDIVRDGPGRSRRRASKSKSR